MTNIQKIRDNIQDKLLHLKNVVGVGIGDKITANQPTGKECIRVYVKSKRSIQSLNKKDIVPKKINEVETDVIEIGEIRAFQYKKYMRPAKCGVSIGHYKITTGTLGALVVDKTTNEILILSNNHVLANSNKAKIGDSIYQPGPYDGGSPSTLLANLSRFVKIQTRSWWAFWKKEPKNRVDCAVATPIDSTDVSEEILDIGTPRDVANVKVGSKLQKTGRTTGHTKGVVMDADVTVVVNYGSFTAKFEHQIMANAMSAGGDSGSLVLDENKNAIGLLFAGSDNTTIINSIHDVLESLNVRLITK